MYRLDVRVDNVLEQGPVIIIEATPLEHKVVATFTRDTALTTLQTIGLGEDELRSILRTFEDGGERLVNVEVDAESLKRAGFLKAHPA